MRSLIFAFSFPYETTLFELPSSLDWVVEVSPFSTLTKGYPSLLALYKPTAPS